MYDKELVRNIVVRVINHTPYQFYINNEIIPGGLLIQDGIVDMDGNAVFIIMREHDKRVKVRFLTNATGWQRTRFTEEPINNVCTMSRVGAAFGMSCMCGYNTRKKPTPVIIEIAKAN